MNLVKKKLLLKRKTIIFLISDFLDHSFYDPMRRINRKHDLINIQILDEAESSLPNAGLIKLHDSETHNSKWINTSNLKNRLNFANHGKHKHILFEKFCKRNNIDLINVFTNLGYIDPLVKFFNSR